MSTDLSNGVIIPEEYSDDWYDEMSINLRKLNDVITAASDNATDIQRLDTLLSGKQASLSQTQLNAVNSGIDSSKVQQIATNTSDISSLQSGKANDNNVMHLSGNETVAGQKTFSDISSFEGSYLGNELSTNERTNFCLRANRDTKNKSCAYISRFRPNKNQGALSGSDNSFISISFLENETRYTRCFDFGLTDWDADGVPQTYYLTSPTSKGALGTSSRKWKTMNGLEPSYLSLPSGNTSDRLDISSYITAFDGTTNSYTPLANGWISISVNNCTEVYVFLNNLYGVDNNRPTAGSIRVTLPVLKGITVGIRITGGSLVFARFLPCQGNV